MPGKEELWWLDASGPPDHRGRPGILKAPGYSHKLQVLEGSQLSRNQCELVAIQIAEERTQQHEPLAQAFPST